MNNWSDPLYRPSVGFPPGSIVHEFAGVACGVVVTDTDPGSAAAQWMNEREVALHVDEDVEVTRLASVVSEFLIHVAAVADRPTSAEVVAASRDVDRGRVLRAAGLAASSVLAVADLRRPDAPVEPGTTIVVRDAQPTDTVDVARLWHAEIEYEGRVGTLRDSAAIRAAVDAAVPGLLDGLGTVLVAERDGEVVGVVVAESVESSEWVGARLTQAPLRYLAMASTDPGARGSGVGAALVGELHDRHRTAGVRLSALHYSPYNPLSVPFWSQWGYRPVLTFFSRPVN